MSKWKVPYLSFDGIHDDIAKELKEAAARVIDSNWYILGGEVSQFERMFADYVGVEHGIGVNSGLDALIIALRCLGVGPGDEVLVASNAYIACWNAIYAVGATIVPVEPDPITFNIDVGLIEAAVTKRTKAIMAVHMFGRMCNMEVIMSVAESHNLYVVEDNAQAQGAIMNGQRSGSIGHINATSFYPGKNLGALGDAGMVTTNNEEWTEMARALRNYGSHEKYHNHYIGMNSRMDEMQAALLAVKLRHLDVWNAERLRIAGMYDEGLRGVSDLRLPDIPKDGSHVCHVYCVRSARRDELQGKFAAKGIQTFIHYPVPPHLQECYGFLGYEKGDFPVAELMAREGLSLPVWVGVREVEVEFVLEVISTDAN